MKGSDERGLELKEENMKLISNHELQQRSESELSALFRTVSEGLIRTGRGTRFVAVIWAQKSSRLAGKHQPGARSPHERVPAVEGRGRLGGPNPIRHLLDAGFQRGQRVTDSQEMSAGGLVANMQDSGRKK
jgi:hypothetical protein